MTLIKSISGFRGTIGGETGNNLTPVDIVESAAAYGQWLKEEHTDPVVVLGRDGRVSGPVVSHLVAATLQAQGIDVIDIGLTTTPTVEMFIPRQKAAGGIMISASHNPMEWNALKLFNRLGEFISEKDGRKIIAISDARNFEFASYDQLGSFRTDDTAMAYHIERVLAHPWVKTEEIRQRKFKVVLDSVNSTGSLSIVPLMEQLGCEVISLNDEINGTFAHNPEPLKEHLEELLREVVGRGADLGIAVDPDVDRVAFVTEEGRMFGEEYTIVAIADYLFDDKCIDRSVSNLSSSRALRDICRRYDGGYEASAVGEVNVVEKMKETGAVFGGEGNGGVIVGNLHYGRDALIGVALFLSGCVHFDVQPSAWKARLPGYEMAKLKADLVDHVSPDEIIDRLAKKYASEEISLADGLKIDFPGHWVHIRRSNTEPILRIYTEAKNQESAVRLAEEFRDEIRKLF